MRKNRHPMNATRQEHFRQLLMSELQIHARHVGEEQARALEIGSDDAGSSDSALRDVIQELAASSLPISRARACSSPT